jgi:DNA-binding transcriptional regulator YbjK
MTEPRDYNAEMAAIWQDRTDPERAAIIDALKLLVEAYAKFAETEQNEITFDNWMEHLEAYENVTLAHQKAQELLKVLE